MRCKRSREMVDCSASKMVAIAVGYDETRVSYLLQSSQNSDSK